MDKPKYNLMQYPKQTYPTNRGNEFFTPNPTNIADLDIISATDRAVAEYRLHYERRHKTAPVLDDEGNFQSFLKSLIRKFGEEKVLGMIRFFIQSDGPKGGYLNMGHSAKCFEWNVDGVNAAYSSTLPKQSGDWNPTIEFYSFCGNIKCNAPTTIVCKGSEAGDRAYTQLCPDCKNKTLARSTNDTTQTNHSF